MLAQIDASKEWQFLVYLIPVIIGIEIAIYFFYQYRKMKDATLPLNRILLAFGCFIIFMVLSPLFLQISRNFVETGLLHELLFRLGWLLGFSSTIMVSIFIIRKEFSSLINLKLAKFLMGINLVPIIIVLTIPSMYTPFTIVCIFLVVINGLYIVRFQVLLIKKTVGKIKRKLKLFLIGALVSFSALIFATLVGLGVLPPNVKEVVYYIGVGILLFGFTILSFSVYKFPPFYEFDWKENLVKLFVINQKTLSPLYHYDFSKHLEREVEQYATVSSNNDFLFSKGIVGIEIIASIITGIGEEKVNKIKKGGYYLYLDYGKNPSFIIYILETKEDLISSHYLLKSIKDRFESFFKEILLNIDNLPREQEKIFESFDNKLNILLQQ